MFDDIRGIAKQFGAESLMIYPDTKTVYMVTPGDVATEKMLPIFDRYIGSPLRFSHIEASTLTPEEKEEGRFYYVEVKQTLDA